MHVFRCTVAYQMLVNALAPDLEAEDDNVVLIIHLEVMGNRICNRPAEEMQNDSMNVK